MSDLRLLDIAIISDDMTNSNKIVHSIFDFNENHLVRDCVNSKIIWMCHDSVQINVHQYNFENIKAISIGKFFHVIICIDRIISDFFEKNIFEKSYKIILIDENNPDIINLLNLANQSNFIRKKFNFLENDKILSISKSIINDGYKNFYDDRKIESDKTNYNEYDIFSNSSNLQKSLLNPNNPTHKTYDNYHRTCCMIS